MAAVEQMGQTLYGNGDSTSPGICETVDWLKNSTFEFAETFIRKDCPDLQAKFKKLGEVVKHVQRESFDLTTFKNTDPIRQKMLSDNILNEVMGKVDQNSIEQNSQIAESKRKIRGIQDYFGKVDPKHSDKLTNITE